MTADTPTDETDEHDDETDDTPEFCPHCDTFDSISEINDTLLCTVCYTTPDGDVAALIDDDTATEAVDFTKDPHNQSVRPRYAGAVKHNRTKQVVMYGAFADDPPLANIEDVR